ncbi:MAG: hypothetical protein KIT09_20875 [Bryobacteraceae bacterium]|nr:hypothetical protein [Bryobacteraceae bacterium]
MRLSSLNVATCSVLLLSLSVGPVSSGERNATAVQDVLWKEPGCVNCKDFRYGPGGKESLPKPPFEFIEEEEGGSSAKVKLRDARGNLWIAKWGIEAKGASFAPRIAWAVGYYVRPSHFVGRGRILGAKNLGRAAEFVDGEGNFQEANFRLIPRELTWLEDRNWTWNDNPFAGSEEGRHALTGLKIIMMLTSNWDAKDGRDESRGANTAIYATNTATPGYIYSFDDWGASMGRWGNVWTREKWNPEQFVEQTPLFIRGINDGYVDFGFDGTHDGDIRKGISVPDVRWIYRYLGKITDKQLRDGLIASGATAEETQALAGALRQRLRQLQQVASLPGSGGTIVTSSVD